MKQYNLTTHRQEREMPFGRLHVVVLGERGRGRYENIIPISKDISDSDLVDISKTKSGRIKIVRGDSSENWLAVLDAEGVYTRNTVGDVFVPSEQMSNVKVLAKGNGAYGAAGRVGVWFAYLAAIKDNTFIYIRPSGGAHKIEGYWVYFGEKEAFKLTEQELAIFCDINDLDMPVKDTVVSLSNVELELIAETLF